MKFIFLFVFVFFYYYFRLLWVCTETSYLSFLSRSLFSFIATGCCVLIFILANFAESFCFGWTVKGCGSCIHIRIHRWPRSFVHVVLDIATPNQLYSFTLFFNLNKLFKMIIECFEHIFVAICCCGSNFHRLTQTFANRAQPESRSVVRTSNMIIIIIIII